ncbi:four helix bundle protein [Mangrovimonas spongiae]|uniref:Four helix bundle protein n=1 Tax=Mangrovimonas spongiae TaxID=2494697 RepID=A0A3R9NQX3_9FLAO|nr:four helix bundle protein [Mangrovimonas spongiae]RSK41515.1 four helix bundle protein [Mangrovimonas spongiae]
MRDFRKYEVWELGHKLTLEVYALTQTYLNQEKYQVISQMQRAAYSIPSNFSEGCGRKTDKEFHRFIQICLGSAHELEYFFILSKDLDYVSDETFKVLSEKINVIKRKLYTLSKRL